MIGVDTGPIWAWVAPPPGFRLVREASDNHGEQGEREPPERVDPRYSPAGNGSGGTDGGGPW